MTETHDFDDTVVAIFDDPTAGDEAVAELSAGGFDFEVLLGEEGRSHLDTSSGSGPGAIVKGLLNSFGDQTRIAKRLDSELEGGSAVISVNAGPDNAERAGEILKEHGGEFIWRLGAWTFLQIED